MKAAQWWINECGGVLCSNCGLFFDDYYEPVPDRCERCGAKMYPNGEVYVDKEYRLSYMISAEYLDKSEYPEWVLELQNNNK